MRIISDPKLDFDDVLIVPKRSDLGSRSEVDLIRKYNFKHSPLGYEGIPVFATNMDSVGTYEMYLALKEHLMGVVLHKFYSIEELTTIFNTQDQMHLWYSMGITDNDLDKYNTLHSTLGAGCNITCRNVCIDVANGYTSRFEDFLKKFREDNPLTVIMAGSVVTPEMTEQLIKNCGVDIVKVGIGCGSVCTTRLKTGVGYPQLSAIIECADAAHGLGGHIVCDGGCKNPADVVKAFAGGADFIMSGSLFAGTDESAGTLISDHHYQGAQSITGRFYKEYYGMSSATAMNKHHGGVASYRAAEGKTVRVPYKGPVEEVVQEILGGLRSACTYVGAHKLKELNKRTTFIRCSDTHNRKYGD